MKSVHPRPHVALLTTSLDVSGAERVLALVADGLADAGYRVSVMGLQRRTGALCDLLRNPAVCVRDLGASGPLDVGVIRRLRRWLVDERVTVLYTFLFHAHLVGRVVGRLARVPHILSSQQVAAWGGGMRRQLDGWTSRWCEYVIAVSESVRTDLVDRMHLPPERVRVIPNAIDVKTFVSRARPFEGVRTGRPTVMGSASRLAPEKDHASLIKGLALARRTTPQLRLRLAGTGPLAGTLAGLVRTLDLEDSVELLGQVENVAAFYDSLDVYVQPSRTEGLPCAVIEAMAMNRPVIATDVPGNRDAVIHGATGWLIPPESETAWAAAIGEAIADPDRAVAFGEAGRRRALTEFDVHEMIQTTVTLIDHMTRSREKDPA